MPRKKLGKGLSELLTHLPRETADDDQHEALKTIPLQRIIPGKFQPRQHIKDNELVELADSIKAQGVIQPIVVQPLKKGLYEIIAGERRWRACRLSGLKTIPALVKTPQPENGMAMALIENIQRENLNPLEEAMAIERLCQKCQITHQVAAQAIGKSRATVSNLIRLLQLQPEVKEMLRAQEIDLGHAKLLLSVKGKAQIALARRIIEAGLSVRATEQLLKAHTQKQPKRSKTVDPDIRRLQNSLSEKVGAKVKIVHTLKGNGKIMINYHNLNELEGILTHIH